MKGTSGRVKTAPGIWLPFSITGFEEGRFWSWNVVGIPATGHRVELREDGLWQLTFEAPILAAQYAYICKMALNRIAGMLE